METPAAAVASAVVVAAVVVAAVVAAHVTDWDDVEIDFRPADVFASPHGRKKGY